MGITSTWDENTAAIHMLAVPAAQDLKQHEVQSPIPDSYVTSFCFWLNWSRSSGAGITKRAPRLSLVLAYIYPSHQSSTNGIINCEATYPDFYSPTLSAPQTSPTSVDLKRHGAQIPQSAGHSLRPLRATQFAQNAAVFSLTSHPALFCCTSTVFPFLRKRSHHEHNDNSSDSCAQSCADCDYFRSRIHRGDHVCHCDRFPCATALFHMPGPGRLCGGASQLMLLVWSNGNKHPS